MCLVWWSKSLINRKEQYFNRFLVIKAQSIYINIFTNISIFQILWRDITHFPFSFLILFKPCYEYSIQVEYQEIVYFYKFICISLYLFTAFLSTYYLWLMSNAFMKMQRKCRAILLCIPKHIYELYEIHKSFYFMHKH